MSARLGPAADEPAVLLDAAGMFLYVLLALFVIGGGVVLCGALL